MSFPAILVGFLENVDGCRVWVPGTKVIEKTKGVVLPKWSPLSTSEESTEENEQSEASTRKNAKDISRIVESNTGKEDAPASIINDVLNDTASNEMVSAASPQED